MKEKDKIGIETTDEGYIVCWVEEDNDVWAMVYGEDAMQVLVDDILSRLKCKPEDIHVFSV